MAKVTAPLQSFTASGSIAKSLTFSSHLGRNVVRRYTIPANTRTEDQGDQRLIFGAAGMGAAAILKKSTVGIALKTIIPSGQTVTSSIVKSIIENFKTADALNGQFELYAMKTKMESKANSIGILGIEVPYAGGEKEISGGAILYALALILNGAESAHPGLLPAAPFGTSVLSWNSTDIDNFVDAIKQ